MTPCGFVDVWNEEYLEDPEQPLFGRRRSIAVLDFA